MSGIQFAELAQHREAVVVGQLVVEQDESTPPGPLERLGGGAGFDDLVAVGAEPLGERPANQLFVVNDQHASGSHMQRSIRGREQRTV